MECVLALTGITCFSLPALSRAVDTKCIEGGILSGYSAFCWLLPLITGAVNLIRLADATLDLLLMMFVNNRRDGKLRLSHRDDTRTETNKHMNIALSLCSILLFVCGPFTPFIDDQVYAKCSWLWRTTACKVINDC